MPKRNRFCVNYEKFIIIPLDRVESLFIAEEKFGEEGAFLGGEDRGRVIILEKSIKKCVKLKGRGVGS
jgi:hypothetical protein